MLRVRYLPSEEGEAIRSLTNRTRNPTLLRRAQVLLHSFPVFSPPRIVSRVFWSVEWVRRVIHDVNRMGRDAL